MAIKLKPVLTLISVGLFLLLAVASFSPDGSSNTMVKVSDCMEKPEMDGILNVIIHHTDKSGTPIPFANGRLYITHQKIIQMEDNCQIVPTFDQIDFITDVNGIYTYSIPFFHNNSSDLNRVQLAIDKTSAYTAFNQVKVAYYATTSLTFNAVSQRLNDL